MSKYLYGAAVQGIQDFIFQTNKLQEIVGASELVEQVCTTEFAKALGFKGSESELLKQLFADEKAIVNAAGNIKYIFDDYDSCQNVVKVLPMQIVVHAPGITISQAVVKFEEASSQDKEDGGGKPEAADFKSAVFKLEEKLRSQRNKPMRSPSIGLMGIERSRQTGLPVIMPLGIDSKPVKLEEEKKEKFYDAGTFRKLFEEERHRNTTSRLCCKAFGEKVSDGKIPFNIEDITRNNDWIAIIHADGNGLGQVIQKIGTEQQKFKEFSHDLDTATKQAAQDAYKSLVDAKKIDFTDNKRIPIRPIVLSGDDHTLICRADLAIPYIEAFINKFEEYTGQMLADKLKEVFKDGSLKLSACAGIAFIKSSYPFYYGYQLAEELCGKAKKHTKDSFGFSEGKLPASCIMFHKVQDSFVTNYDDIVKRELTPNKDCSLNFGPYYISKVAEGKWSVQELLEKAEMLSSDKMTGIKTGLRRWLSAVSVNNDAAYQLLTRLESNYKSDKGASEQESFLKDVFSNKTCYPVYDILAINTICTQKTK